MLQKFDQHICAHFPFLKEKKLLIACSGGLDSVVLSRLLKELKYNISLAHCNFSLRGKESDGDENFVVAFADKLSIPIFSKSFNTKVFSKKNSMSTQMAARELRYRWFNELCEKHNYDYLLTAHHLDDDLETFFINLSRGTGLRGLVGIPEINHKTVRPLLFFSRDEIYLYAKENNLVWREDSSNLETDYLRNKLRLEVIPNYKEVNENVLSNFNQTQKHLQDSQLLVNDYMVLIQNLVVREKDDVIEIDIYKLKELPNTNALLYELLFPFGFSAWEDIFNLLDAQSGKKVYSNSHCLLKNRDTLLLTQKDKINKEENYFILEEMTKLEAPIYMKIEKVSKVLDFNNKTAYLDLQKIKFPLNLRKWQEGDVFHPFGMKGKKKLSKFFKDEKLSLVAKEKTWVLCSENQIVWVVGMRLDERFKVENDTKEIIKITLN